MDVMCGDTGLMHCAKNNLSKASRKCIAGQTFILE